MKTFVIFPTICVSILTWTLLSLLGQMKRRTKFVLTILATIIFGGLMTWFSVDLLVFLYFSNFVSIILVIPCMTYLIYNWLPNQKIEGKYLRIFAIGLLSTVLTLAIFGTAMFFALAYNAEPIQDLE